MEYISRHLENRILETLGIIFLLHPYSDNVLKRTVKTPKDYK